MKTRILAMLNITLLGASFSLAILPSMGLAIADDKPTSAQTSAQATEDIIFMSDGRELHGQIISKSKTQVVFEYHDAKLKIKTKLTISMDDVAKIDEDVALPDAKTAQETDAKTPQKSSLTLDNKDKDKAEEAKPTYGASRVQSDKPGVPSFYIVPMKGQMGTDINSELYEKVREDIKVKKPDFIVIEMNCQDEEDVLYSIKGREEGGLMDMDDFRKVVNIFQDDLREFKQVCWIHDSLGISSTVALTWPNLYMKPHARLGGLQVARDQIGFEFWSDDDVRGKMTAAFMAWIEGFLISGNYATELASAMVRPKYQLSATWKGREVIWALNADGEYVVDSNDKRTTNFRAKDAEDLCISDGTADSLDDLVLLLGHREYRVADGESEKLCSDYSEDWRRAYEDAKVLFEDYQQFMGWASGEDAVKFLGKAKSTLEKILSSMKTYKPVEVRLGRDFGVNQTELIVLIEQIKEQLRALKKANSGGGVGGGGGGGGGGGLGGG